MVSKRKGESMNDYKLNEPPLSERAKIQIQKYISQMDLTASNKLPREEELATLVGVSRITIRKALDDLASEGAIFRRHGKGTFVNVDSLSIKVKFNPAMEFTQMIRACGYQPSVRLLSISLIPYDKIIAGHLQLAPGEQLVMTEKLFLADQKTCAYCVDYFSLSLIGGQDSFERFTQYENSIFEYIYQMSGEKIQWDKIEIGAVSGTEIPQIRRHLDLHGFEKKALLCLRGVNYNAQDQPLIYAEEYIDTTMISFSMIRQRTIQYSNDF